MTRITGKNCYKKSAEEKTARVSRRQSCRMICNKCQMRLTRRHCRRKTQLTNVRHVVFGDQLFFGQPFVKRFALYYRTVVCLSVSQSCLSLTLVGYSVVYWAP